MIATVLKEDIAKTAVVDDIHDENQQVEEKHVEEEEEEEVDEEYVRLKDMSMEMNEI